jgi:hypothetical protein
MSAGLPLGEAVASCLADNQADRADSCGAAAAAVVNPLDISASAVNLPPVCTMRRWAVNVGKCQPSQRQWLAVGASRPPPTPTLIHHEPPLVLPFVRLQRNAMHTMQIVGSRLGRSGTRLWWIICRFVCTRERMGQNADRLKAGHPVLEVVHLRVESSSQSGGTSSVPGAYPNLSSFHPRRQRRQFNLKRKPGLVASFSRLTPSWEWLGDC